MMGTDCPRCDRATLILRRRTQDTDLRIFYCKTCDFARSEPEDPSLNSSWSTQQKAA
jgi:hypothetical protein